MPISKSAKKAYRSSERKRKHNLEAEKKLKFALKKVDQKNISKTISIIDKAAKNRIISSQKAGRLKSRMMKKFATPRKPKPAVTPKTPEIVAKKTNKKAKTNPKSKTSPKK